MIEDPRLHACGVKTKSLFEFELSVPGEGQFEDAQCDASNEQETSHRQDRSAEARVESYKRPWQRAAEKQCDEHQDIEYARDISKAALGQRVVNRTVIRRVVNDSAKWTRHLIPVRAHVPLIEPAQPQFSARARKNQNQSNDGERRHEQIVLLLLSS